MFFRLFFDFLFQCLPDCILYAVELLQKTVPFFDAEFLIADPEFRLCIAVLKLVVNLLHFLADLLHETQILFFRFSGGSGRVRFRCFVRIGRLRSFLVAVYIVTVLHIIQFFLHLPDLLILCQCTQDPVHILRAEHTDGLGQGIDVIPVNQQASTAGQRNVDTIFLIRGISQRQTVMIIIADEDHPIIFNNTVLRHLPIRHLILAFDTTVQPHPPRHRRQCLVIFLRSLQIFRKTIFRI